MENSIDIIEIIEGKYVLNTDLLRSALTLADNCDNIALISIVGPKSHGKTFFINCLINYMNSDHKNEWPRTEEVPIKMNYRPPNNGDIKPVIKLTSSPFIIKDETSDEVNGTAVYLMDSDLVFDIEMSSQKVQDMIALFLLTSSTVIYNHKRHLPAQEFVQLESISSQISNSENCLESLKDVLFLIRDWSPQIYDKQFGFGLYEGSKYIDNFIKNTKLERSYHDLNCFLMSEPVLDNYSELINLVDLNEIFLHDFKNVIDFKLLNTDEMPKKRKLNSNEFMNSKEFIELFEICIKKLNQNIDTNLLVDNLSAGIQKLTISDNPRDEIRLNGNKSDPVINESEIEPNNGINTTEDCESSHSGSFEIIDDEKDGTENITIKSPEISPSNEKIESYNKESDLIDFTSDNENDKVLCLSSSESAEEDYKDESFTLLEQTVADLMTDDESDNCGNESNENSSNLLNLEKKIKAEEKNLKDVKVNNMTKFENNLITYSTKEPVNKKNEQSNDNYKYTTKPNNNGIPHRIDERRNSDPIKCLQLTNSDLLEQDSKGDNYHYSMSYFENKSNNSYISIKTHSILDNVKVDETSIKIGVEKDFNDLVDELILEYNENIEMKLNDQFLDLDIDLKKAHEDEKLKILEKLKKRWLEIKPYEISKNYRVRYHIKLNDKMEEAIKLYRNKAKTKLDEAKNQYERVLRQISGLYKLNLKISFTVQLKDNFNFENSTRIQRTCEEKALKTFREETVKFFKGNTEKLFLKKLNEAINQINYNHNKIWDHYKAYKIERERIFSNLNYYSEQKIKEFHDNQKSRIKDSLLKHNDTELIELTFSLLEKSFNSFNDINKFNEKKERNFALKAIALSVKLFEECFETKLRLGFFDPVEINNIGDQLFEYTLKTLMECCHFNQYQTYLADSCEEGLRLKVEEISKRVSKEYKEKVDITEKKMREAIKESFESYCKLMKLVPTQKKTYMKSNEFVELHHNCSKLAINNLNESLGFLKQNFGTEFANKILLERKSDLRKLISREKEKLKTLNDKNTPVIPSMAIYLGKQYIISATFRNNSVEIITDKFNEKLRPNLISFSEKFRFGNDAKIYYQNFFPKIASFENFDIKQLMGRERGSISDNELNAYPFSFLTNKLSVNVDYHDFHTDLSIESLLAFMILDIKSCAEKQIGSEMSNIVLTVPTNYTMNQKNAIKNAAKIAGLEGCDIISEISAAAINYAFGRLKFYKNFKDTVLFVIINDYECDVAVCVITNKKIEYKAYKYKNLNSTEEEKKNFIQKIMKFNIKSKQNNYDLTKHKFEDLIDKVLKKTNINQIDEYVIAGKSTLIPFIKDWINKDVNPIPLLISNSHDIIINGSTIYGEMLSNKITFIEISEVTTHAIYLNFDIKLTKGEKLVVMPANTALPSRKSITFNSPKSSDLPLKITVSQDNQIVLTHFINELPFSDYTNHGYKKHVIDFRVECFGQIYVMSFLTNKNNSSGIKLESKEINPGLSNKELGKEKQKFKSLINKIEEETKINEEKLVLRQAIEELKNHCLSIKNEVMNNEQLRPLIKKQILIEIEKTLSSISSDYLDLKDINKIKLMLNKTIKGYNIYCVKTQSDET